MAEFKFNPKSSVIILTPLLEGERGLKRKTKMVLDTGSTYVMISWELAEVLGVKPQKVKEWVNLTTASTVERAPLITLKAITVLSKKVETVRVTVKNLPEKSLVDGLLGLSFLRNFNLKIDFKNGFLELN